MFSLEGICPLYVHTNVPRVDTALALYQVNGVISSLEDSLQLLCLTGVEDQLQTDVRPTLELLRNAGIRVSEFNCSEWK